MYEYAVKVVWAHSRPPTSANCRTTWVRVWAHDDTDAQLIAAHIVQGHPECVMVTATQIVEVIL